MPLHQTQAVFRSARGQPLTPEEQSVLDAGRAALGGDEQLLDVRGAREARDRLRTLEVESEVPAKIPEGGLPVTALKHLIEIGLKGGDDL